MADVTPPDDRGQLLLTAALAMAVLFVGLALLFNTAIYTENLGSRNAGVAPAGATEYRSNAADGTAELVRAVNRHNHTSDEALRANLSAGVTAWSAAADVYGAYRGRATNATLAETNNGTRIVQRDVERNFTNRSGDAAWEPVGSTAGVRGFRMNVSRSSLLSDPTLLINDVYHVNVTDDDGDTWSIYFYELPTNPETRVAVRDPSGAESACTGGNATHVPVDLTAGTVNGTDCAALGFWGKTSGNVSIRYRHADNIEGTYRLVVDPVPSTVDDDDFFDESTTSSYPIATDAIYAADVAVTYESANVYYRGEIRVAPGEPQ